MMKFAVGMVLIDAPHSALNMSGTEQGAERNRVVVKKLRSGRYDYPYVSAQAWRYWWRCSLKEHLDWNISKLIKVAGKNQVYTAANPIKYDDDDVFGYMRALGDNQTVTRISPLKTTPLVSTLPTQNSTSSNTDSFSRHEGDPVLYEQQFYSTIFKGAFSLDLESLGRFTLVDKAGYKNIIRPEGKSKKTKESQEEFDEMLEAAKKLGTTIEDKEWILPDNLRRKRAGDVIRGLRYISGGANQTLFLTDIVPKFTVFGMFDGGINPFINDIVKADKGEVKFDMGTLKSRIEQHKDIMNPKMLIIGKDPGFYPEWDENLRSLQENVDNMEIKVDNVVNAVDYFAQQVEKYYESS